MEGEGANYALVESIVLMAARLRMDVTAEGVENEQHAQLLTDMGANLLQGYHFARPMPADEVEVFLRDFSPPLGGDAAGDAAARQARR